MRTPAALIATVTLLAATPAEAASLLELSPDASVSIYRYAAVVNHDTTTEDIDEGRVDGLLSDSMAETVSVSVGDPLSQHAACDLAFAWGPDGAGGLDFRGGLAWTTTGGTEDNTGLEVDSQIIVNFSIAPSSQMIGTLTLTMPTEAELAGAAISVLWRTGLGAGQFGGNIIDTGFGSGFGGHPAGGLGQTTTLALYGDAELHIYFNARAASTSSLAVVASFEPIPDAVPEPASLALAALGAGGVLARRRAG